MDEGYCLLSAGGFSHAPRNLALPLSVVRGRNDDCICSFRRVAQRRKPRLAILAHGLPPGRGRHRRILPRAMGQELAGHRALVSSTNSCEGGSYTLRKPLLRDGCVAYVDQLATTGRDPCRLDKGDWQVLVILPLQNFSSQSKRLAKTDHA